VAKKADGFSGTSVNAFNLVGAAGQERFVEQISEDPTR
jgi:hypothetical protein